METYYIEARHSTCTCDGHYGLGYEKFIIENNKQTQSFYWRDNMWIDEQITEERKRTIGDTNLQRLIEAGKPILMESGWTYRIMSSLEALVMFGKEE